MKATWSNRHSYVTVTAAGARIIAHELYHVIAQTSDHGRDGVSKPCFGVSDLLAERFAFEQTALAKLKAADSPAESPAAVSGDVLSGR